MKGKAAAGIFAMVIGISGYCLAAEPKVVSHEHAAKEAFANRKLANTLWEQTHQSCAAKDWSKQSSIMQTISQQLAAQPINHQNYSARTAFSSCRQMLSDISFINGACFNKSPTQHETDHFKRIWKQDAERCNTEISSPALSLAEPSPEQMEQKWETEQRKQDESEEDIAFMKQLRNS